MLCRHPAPGHTPGRCREVRRSWDGEGADGAPPGRGTTGESRSEPGRGGGVCVRSRFGIKETDGEGLAKER